ncbi:MAG: (2Fe-2S) ferredoxin domain-containing protein [Kofleriaceae bacterium]|jgi:NADH:ubiquinone oxidoreductase subunit E|nr:(2Fe-2S) ferredoxin domain-containing protein [Kofleriaceae bacterium]MBP6839072.1 (2Fe-2S) ferredoxin domain-containing protein [Kofleriaceae bacterium]MBP9207801.1 (2Fe-2S) ferredoxin domain-containing protein [Kofleriaceae bacterium]
MSKVPTRSPTHREVDLGRLAALGLEVDELAEDGVVTLAAVTELAEDRGRPVSHYLAGLALATETTLAVTPGLPVLTVCAGKCQSWGALDLLDHAAEMAPRRGGFALRVVSCLDRCDQAPAATWASADGTAVLAPATRALLDEAIASAAR